MTHGEQSTCGDGRMTEAAIDDDILRKNTLHMRNKLANVLGDKGKEYWAKFKNFINGRCSKREFDATMLRALRKRDSVKLHNELLLAIIYNASKRQYPPTTCHKGFGALDPLKSPVERKVRHRMSTQTWSENYAMRIIRSFSKKDYLRLTKLSQMQPYVCRDSFSRREAYWRDIKSSLNKRIEHTSAERLKRFPRLCCESGGLPTEKNVRDIQLLCSVQEGLSQGKESRTCASLMLLGAKYMIKNYISRVLFTPEPPHEHNKESLLKLLNFDGPGRSGESAAVPSRETGEGSSSAEGKILAHGGMPKSDRKSDESISAWYEEQVYEVYRRKLLNLATQDDVVDTTMLRDLADIGTSEPFPEVLPDACAPVLKPATVPGDGGVGPLARTALDQDLHDSSDLAARPTFTSAYKSLELINRHMSDRELPGGAFAHDSIPGLANITTPFSIENSTGSQIPFISLDNCSAQGGVQTSFDLKSSGISSLSSVSTFNKLLLQLDPVFVQEHISVSGGPRPREDLTTLLSLDDIYFRSYLDFHILAPSYATIRLLESVRFDPDLPDKELEPAIDYRNFMSV